MPHDRLPTDAAAILAEWREAGERIVFTNGVFDLVHRGHVEYLEEARLLGDRLVVGVNADASVLRLGKGSERPLLGEAERVELLQALESVDLVTVFADDSPECLIQEVAPDVLVKGADWSLESVAGREFVEARGGRVELIHLREGRSTSVLLERIRVGT